MFSLGAFLYRGRSPVTYTAGHCIHDKFLTHNNAGSGHASLCVSYSIIHRVNQKEISLDQELVAISFYLSILHFSLKFLPPAP